MSTAGGEDHREEPADLDLATQLEDLLHAVWRGEENWRFDDRLELSLKSVLGRRGHITEA